jgi:predicted TPR repeat methyltransferase
VGALLIGVVLSPLSAQPAPDGAGLWRQAQSEQLAGQWKKAVVTLSTLLKMQPQHLNAMAALGFSYFKSGDLEAAEKQYRQVLSLHNRHVGAGYGLGQVMMSRKKWKEAAGCSGICCVSHLMPKPIRAVIIWHSRCIRWSAMKKPRGYLRSSF